MSTATKVFTVLLVVLAIAFSMATVSFVARTHDWRKLATDYRRQAHAAYTQLANVEAAISKAKEDADSDKDGHALDLICTSYLSLNPGERSMADFLASYEKVF